MVLQLTSFQCVFYSAALLELLAFVLHHNNVAKRNQARKFHDEQTDISKQLNVTI